MNPVTFALHVEACLILVDDPLPDKSFFERRFNRFKALMGADEEALNAGNRKAMAKEIFKHLTHAGIGQQLDLT